MDDRQAGRKPASAAHGPEEVARIIEERVTPLVGLAEAQGHSFLAYLLNMAQLEAAALAGCSRRELGRGTGSHG